MQLRDYVFVVRDHLRLIATLLLVGLLCGVAVAVAYPKTYAASAKLFVGTAATNAVNSTATAAQLSSYSELGSSDLVLRPVIRELGLHESVSHLATSVSITNPTGTVVLDVDVTDGDARQAAVIANQVVQSLRSAVLTLARSSRQSVAAGSVTITQQAVVPTAPVSPNRILALVLGVVAGAAVGIAAAAIRHQSRAPLSSVDDVERITGAHPVGMFGRLGARRRHRAGARSLNESARGLCAQLLSRSPGVALMTAPDDRADAVALTIAVARTAASMGASVCVVEADLRAPRLARALGAAPSPGLAALLDATSTVDEVVTRDGADQISVIAADQPGDSARIMTAERTRPVLEDLARRFELVLVVAPPVQRGPETLLIAGSVASTIVVVRLRTTTQLQLRDSTVALLDAGARVGTVVTDLPTRMQRVIRAPSELLSIRDHPDQVAWSPDRLELSAVPTNVSPFARIAAGEGTSTDAALSSADVLARAAERRRARREQRRASEIHS